jgi:phospholipid/cholesterol/gamma-HCH transport system substrate-binding protein
MPTTGRRNFMIGLTVAAALAIFVWMVLRFGTKTAGLFAPPQQDVVLDAPRVDGLAEGSPLTYQGVTVGRITKLARNASGNGVSVYAKLDTQPPVPMNIHAEIVTTNLIGGGAAVALELNKQARTGLDEPPKFPEPGTPRLPIPAIYVGLKLNLLPPQYEDVAVRISRAASAIADASDEISQRHIVEHLDETIQNANDQIATAGKVLQDFQDILGDTKVQQDLRQTIINIRKTSDELARVSADLPQLSHQASGVLSDAHTTLVNAQGRFDDLSRQLAASLANASALLDTVHDISRKIDQGQGTAGLLVNDPKLYESLLQSSRQLNTNLLDLQRLIEQWEQDGLSLKVK